MRKVKSDLKSNPWWQSWNWKWFLLHNHHFQFQLCHPRELFKLDLFYIIYRPFVKKLSPRFWSSISVKSRQTTDRQTESNVYEPTVQVAQVGSKMKPKYQFCLLIFSPPCHTLAYFFLNKASGQNVIGNCYFYCKMKIEIFMPVHKISVCLLDLLHISFATYKYSQTNRDTQRLDPWVGLAVDV